MKIKTIEYMYATIFITNLLFYSRRIMMRSAFLFLQNYTLSQAKNLLNNLAEKNGTGWLINSKENDPILYIRVDQEFSLLNEFDEDEVGFEKLVEIINNYIIVIIDISGRHNGKIELIEFINNCLLNRNGYVMDDYTYHLWTIDEINGNKLVENHPFFDYNGWYKANKNS